MNPEPAVTIARVDPCWVDAAHDCLCPDEVSRGARFHQSAHRDTWRAGRAWVRHQLAASLAVAPRSITFNTDDRGRPRVVGAPPGFDANWSHSGPWMGLAISFHGPTGIDLEIIRPDVPVVEVEPAVCTPMESTALAAAPDPLARQRLFFSLWTAKEALMKATGLGAALDPTRIAVHCPHGQPEGYASHPGWQLSRREAVDWMAAWTWRP